MKFGVEVDLSVPSGTPHSKFFLDRGFQNGGQKRVKF